MRHLDHPLWSILAVAALVAPLPPSAAAAQEKPRVAVEEYAQFERVGFRRALSHDGAFFAYEVSTVGGTHELRVRATAEGGETRTFENGQRPTFAETSRHLAWTVRLPEAERKKLQDAGKPVHAGVGLLDLTASGDEAARTFEEVASWAFDATGRFLALLGESPEEPKGKGADLRVLDLEEGTEASFGNVDAMAWADEGSLLALVLRTGADRGNGVQVYDAASGRLRSLDTSAKKYGLPTWREDAPDLAVVRSEDAASAEEPVAATVLAWRGLDQRDIESFELEPGAAPDDLQATLFRAPEWSPDGTRVAVGLRPCPDDGCRREEEEDETDDDVAAEDEETPGDEASEDSEGDDAEAAADASDTEAEEPDLPKLQIWHTKDRRLFPQQQKNNSADERRTLLAVWHLDTGALVQVGTELRAETVLTGDWATPVELTRAPYGWGEMFGRPYSDVWAVDARSGERTLALEKARHIRVSPEGRYVHWFDGRDHLVLDLPTRERHNLTAGTGATFRNVEYDTPTDLPPPYGNGGWLKDDAGVLLNTRFDVWLAVPGGATRRLTDGEADQWIHRVTDMDPEEAWHDPARGLHFALRNETTEQRGLAHLPESALQSGGGQVQFGPRGDVALGRFTRARDGEELVYLEESAADSPDFFVTSANLRQPPRQISATNPWASDYAWTRSELLDYRTSQGKDLQAALLYPAGYEEGETYPMIVYTYEILAPQIHRFDVPDERRYYSYAAWTQAGYFVLLPDIVYTAREPGPSALAAVEAAVKTVTDRGLADPDRVGLIGHSWGGYQATYLPTRTNLFAASVAGAPLTDFVSFMGQLHWNPGIAEVSHWETGQARMEVPFWEDPDAHRRSSPIHKVHEMETPLLMAFGNEDGVVDWDQGTEFFNFARRAGKQMVLLVYEGEDHGFSNEANQRDYHRRILEWFGHYLKGEPAPAWITEGIAFDVLEDEKKRVATLENAAENAARGDRPEDP